MTDEKHKGPTRNEAFARYEEIKHQVIKYQRLDEHFPLRDLESKPPSTLFTGTGINMPGPNLKNAVHFATC